MKKIKEYEKITKNTTEVYELFSDLIVLAELTNNVQTSLIIYRKEDVEIGDEINCLKNERFRYYSDKTLEEIRSKRFFDVNLFEQNVLELKNIKRENILRADGCSQLFYDLDGYPMTCIYTFDQCSNSPTNLEYDLDKLKEYLKDKKEVLDIRIEDIPYYNAKFSGHQEMILKILFSQEDINNFWDEIKDMDFPSTRLKEIIMSPTWVKLDPLGLKQFRYSDKIIEAKQSMV